MAVINDAIMARPSSWSYYLWRNYRRALVIPINLSPMKQQALSRQAGLSVAKEEERVQMRNSLPLKDRGSESLKSLSLPVLFAEHSSAHVPEIASYCELEIGFRVSITREKELGKPHRSGPLIRVSAPSFPSMRRWHAWESVPCCTRARTELAASNQPFFRVYARKKHPPLSHCHVGDHIHPNPGVDLPSQRSS